jgi:hypothetical protein
LLKIGAGRWGHCTDQSKRIEYDKFDEKREKTDGLGERGSGTEEGESRVQVEITTCGLHLGLCDKPSFSAQRLYPPRSISHRLSLPFLLLVAPALNLSIFLRPPSFVAPVLKYSTRTSLNPLLLIVVAVSSSCSPSAQPLDLNLSISFALRVLWPQCSSTLPEPRSIPTAYRRRCFLFCSPSAQNLDPNLPQSVGPVSTFLCILPLSLPLVLNRISRTHVQKLFLVFISMRLVFSITPRAGNSPRQDTPLQSEI